MALTLACNNPPNGTVGSSYSHQMTLSGGTAPYVVTVDSGSLPPGLSISNTALITGIPSTAGTYPFTIGAHDSVGTIDLLSPKTDWFSGYDWSAENPSLPGISVDGDWIKVTPNAGLVPSVLALKDYSTPLDTTNGGTADPNDTVQIRIRCSDWSKMLWLDLTLFTDHSATGAQFFDYRLYASDGAFDGLAPYDTLTITTKRSDWSATPGADWASITRLDVFPVLTSETAIAWFKDFTVSAGASSQVECSITVNTAPLVLECNNPPAGSVGISYHHHMTLSGGVGPYTVSISDGALPDGLTISNQAVINGTPTTVGTFSFDVTATDSALTSQTVSCSVTTAVPELTLECANPPSGSVGHAYTHQMLLVGGTSPYTVTIASGALPTGLTISNTGQITGTPTASGTFVFTVRAVGS